MEIELDEWLRQFSQDDVHFNDGQTFPETLYGGAGSDGDSDDDPENIYVYMDIGSTIQMLQDRLGEYKKKDLRNYKVWLQNVKILEPFKTLHDQCLEGKGLVKVFAQIFNNLKCINIADIFEAHPEEVDSVMENDVGENDQEHPAECEQ